MNVTARRAERTGFAGRSPGALAAVHNDFFLDRSFR
jgi:hypothetical protein